MCVFVVDGVLLKLAWVDRRVFSDLRVRTWKNEKRRTLDRSKNNVKSWQSSASPTRKHLHLIGRRDRSPNNKQCRHWTDFARMPSVFFLLQCLCAYECVFARVLVEEWKWTEKLTVGKWIKKVSVLGFLIYLYRGWRRVGLRLETEFMVINKRVRWISDVCGVYVESRLV